MQNSSNLVSAASQPATARSARRGATTHRPFLLKIAPEAFANFKPRFFVSLRITLEILELQNNWPI